jgi:hypothetical protein
MAKQTRKKTKIIKAHCQCDPKCPRKALPGHAFCKVHMKFCPRRSPLTGFEPSYNPDKYNGTRKMKESHNCFAYAFDHVEMPPDSECNESMCNTPFHQPGRKSGFPRWSETKGKRCPDLISRLRADIPGIKTVSFTEKCPVGTSKIALAVAPDSCKKDEVNNKTCLSKKHGDYHFWRQDNNGMWSHKPGGTDVTNKDASKRSIYDPSLANRNYGDRLNYKYFCSFLCAPKKQKLSFKRGGKNKHTRSKSKV